MCTDRNKLLIDLVVNLVKADGYCNYMAAKGCHFIFHSKMGTWLVGGPYAGWRKWKNVPSLTTAVLTSTHWWPVRDGRERKLDAGRCDVDE
jgi:hypothetical protein